MCRLWLLLVPFGADACAFATVPGKPLPTSSTAAQAPRQERVTYHIQATYRGLDAASLAGPFESSVRAGLAGILPASEEVTSPSIPDRGDFVSVRLAVREPGLLHVAWFVGSSTVACLIPVVATTRYELNVDVFRDGQVVKRYRYQNYVRDWCVFFPLAYLPALKSRPRPANFFANIVDAFLGDFSRDFLQGERLP